MADLNQIEKHAEVIGADGVHVGTVDHVSDRRIKLTKKDSVDGRHHYIDAGLVADIENGVGSSFGQRRRGGHFGRW